MCAIVITAKRVKKYTPGCAQNLKERKKCTPVAAHLCQ